MSNQFYCKICGGLFNKPAKGNKRLFCDGCKPQAEKVYQAEYYKRKKAEKEQMRADAALGRAVRKMPTWTFLYQNSIGWFSGTEMTHGTRTYGPKCDTPEAALQAVGLIEVK